MSAREQFDRICDQVCEEQGWGRSENQIEVKFEEGRRQIVFLEFFDFEGEELVRLYSVIGSVEAMNPLKLTQALRLNFGLPHGALAVHADELVMIDTLMVEDADPGEIEASAAYLAETGDHFEKTMFGSDQH
ncbi:MAG: hypothetical protein ACQGVK_20950 [Myxococcota bacterium]